MDPRYGELSRAMRNRAVEIHLSEPMAESADMLRWMTPIEGSLQRLAFVASIAKDAGADLNRDLVHLALQNLTEADIMLLSRFSLAVDGGIIGSFDAGNARIKEFLDLLHTKTLGTLTSAVGHLYTFLPSSLAPSISKFQVCYAHSMHQQPLTGFSANFPNQKPAVRPSHGQNEW
jgi:midasin